MRALSLDALAFGDITADNFGGDIASSTDVVVQHPRLFFATELLEFREEQRSFLEGYPLVEIIRKYSLHIRP